MGRSWRIGLAGMLLALGACGQVAAEDPDRSTSDRGGAVQLAASQTCTPGSGPDCVSVGGEHIVVTASDFIRVGVVSATPARDGIPAIDVEFDAEGAMAFSQASKDVVEKGDGGRLVLRADEHVLGAVRVPSPLAPSELRIFLQDDLSAEDAARWIIGG